MNIQGIITCDSITHVSLTDAGEEVAVVLVGLDFLSILALTEQQAYVLHRELGNALTTLEHESESDLEAEQRMS